MLFSAETRYQSKSICWTVSKRTRARSFLQILQSHFFLFDYFSVNLNGPDPHFSKDSPLLTPGERSRFSHFRWNSIATLAFSCPRYSIAQEQGRTALFETWDLTAPPQKYWIRPQNNSRTAGIAYFFAREVEGVSLVTEIPGGGDRKAARIVAVKLLGDGRPQRTGIPGPGRGPAHCPRIRKC